MVYAIVIVFVLFCRTYFCYLSIVLSVRSDNMKYNEDLINDIISENYKKTEPLIKKILFYT